MERGVIEVAPIAFMRGRTLNESFIILDEAQNTTTEQMKMFLTRLGFNSKAVINGDVTQIDLPSSRASGLREAREVCAASKASPSSISTRPTWCATRWCSGSSPPTRRSKTAACAPAWRLRKPPPWKPCRLPRPRPTSRFRHGQQEFSAAGAEARPAQRHPAPSAERRLAAAAAAGPPVGPRRAREAGHLRRSFPAGRHLVHVAAAGAAAARPGRRLDRRPHLGGRPQPFRHRRRLDPPAAGAGPAGRAAGLRPRPQPRDRPEAPDGRPDGRRPRAQGARRRPRDAAGRAALPPDRRRRPQGQRAAAAGPGGEGFPPELEERLSSILARILRQG